MAPNILIKICWTTTYLPLFVFYPKIYSWCERKGFQRSNENKIFQLKGVSYHNIIADFVWRQMEHLFSLFYIGEMAPDIEWKIDGSNFKMTLPY